jgi:hypothetical protein
MVGRSVRAALAAVLLVAGVDAARAADPPSEHEVKAAFLFHFARLTEWPEAAAPKDQPFVVAIIGEDPFGPTLERVLASQTVEGRPLQIRRVATAEALGERPHIAFISASHHDEVGRVLRHFRGQPVLTVSEMEGFGERGGIVNFVVTAEGRVRFEINVREADASGLKLSSQVLKLARIVGAAP